MVIGRWFTYREYNELLNYYIDCTLICNVGPLYAGAKVEFITVDTENMEITFRKSWNPHIYEKYRLYLTVGEKIEQEPKRNYE